MELADYIRIRRAELGFSIRELAKQAGLSHSYISTLEAGGHMGSGRSISPTTPTLQKLARGLRVPYEKLDRVVRGLPLEPTSTPYAPDIQYLLEIASQLPDEDRRELIDFAAWKLGRKE